MAEGEAAKDSSRSALEQALDAALEARARGGEQALARWLEEHPAQSAAVREHLARLEALGLLASRSDAPREGAPAPAPLERLGGFRLVERLGEGGMGLVWVAEELALGRRVALKMIRPEQLWFAGARERFRRELEAVARLQHPGIVPVYSAGEEGGLPFFTMELVDGCTLADVLRELRGADPAALRGADLARALDRAAPPREGAHGARGPLFELGWSDACLQLTRQVAEALDYAHGRGLVHRDVKPSNVALTRSGRALLFDFGLVHSDGAEPLTRTSAQPGSLPYMSPEQVRGERELDGRSDVYSLGATLYELLTLQPAFESTNATELVRRIGSGELLRPRARVPSLAWDVETVCLKALAPARAERYASADELARDLGNLLARRPIEARRAGFGLRLLRWAQRRPRTSASLLVALPLAALAFAGLAWLERARGAEILRLADVRRLADLEEEAERLWPATPERVDAYEGWLARADGLLARLPLHRATLAALEQEASAPPARAERADAASDVPADPRNPAPAGAPALRFADDETRWQHDTLAGLIGALERLADPEAGLRGELAERLAFARTIEERSRSGAAARAAWDEARRSIADARECPAYHGLALAPQLGLLPLGRDPESGLWEFAHLASGEPTARDERGELVLTPASGIVLVLLPGGPFRMGSAVDPKDPEYDPLAEDEETPVHEVTLAPFFLGKHELTRSQWARMARLVLDEDDAWSPLAPITQVSWDDASRLLARVGLALPTEAQWEYGARGGTRTPWWTGATKESLAGAANLLDRSLRDAGRAPPGLALEEWLDDGFVELSPVDALRANAFGLHDVAGNATEWCRDLYARYDHPVGEGDGLRLGSSASTHLLRGGACVSPAPLARSAWRAAQSASSSNWALGLRASRALDAER